MRQQQAFSQGWQKPDRRPIYEWAEENVTLPPALTKNGPFRIAESRHLIAPFEALADDHVREVVVVAPIRGAKTLIPDIWLPWCVVNDPGSFMWIMQTDPIVTQHMEGRTFPILEACNQTRSLFPQDRHKKSSGRIIFGNGMLFYANGPSIGNLQSKGIRYMVRDEVWIWEEGKMKEAAGRLGDFEEAETSKLLTISQAGNEGDELDEAFNKGNQNHWYIQCEKCGHFQAPRMTGQRDDGSRFGLIWDKHRDSKGRWEISKVLPTVRYECQACAHPHIYSNRLKNEWNRTGKYVAANKDAPRKYAGFHYNAIITRSWVALAEEYLSSLNTFKQLGIVLPLIQFFQKRMAEAKSEGAILEGQSEFTRVAYEVLSTWADELYRFMTIDRQEDCFYYVIRAWSKTGESRRLAFGKVFSFQDLEVVREQFQVLPRRTFCDSGYMPKGDNGVYAACHRFGWIGLKGDKQDTYWHEEPIGGRKVRVCHSYSDFQFMDGASGTSGQGRSFCKHMMFSATIMADRLKGLIEKGKWLEPAVNLEDEKEKDYNNQMHSERKAQKRNKVTNRVEWIWVKIRDANHYWDCAKMQICVATACRILPDVLDTTDSAQATPSVPILAT